MSKQLNHVDQTRVFAYLLPRIPRKRIVCRDCSSVRSIPSRKNTSHRIPLWILFRRNIFLAAENRILESEQDPICRVTRFSDFSSPDLVEFVKNLVMKLANLVTLPVRSRMWTASPWGSSSRGTNFYSVKGKWN